MFGIEVIDLVLHLGVFRRHYFIVSQQTLLILISHELFSRFLV